MYLYILSTKAVTKVVPCLYLLKGTTPVKAFVPFFFAFFLNVFFFFLHFKGDHFILFSVSL